MNTINAKIENQFGKDIITIHFAYDKATLDYVKSIKNAKYSGSLKCWYVPYSDESARLLGVAKPQNSEKIERRFSSKQNILGVNVANMDLFIRELKKDKNEVNTQKTYIQEFSKFLSDNKNKDIAEFTLEDIRDYLLLCINKYNTSETTMFSRLNTLNFFYTKVKGKNGFLKNFPKPQRPARIEPLNGDEIHTILSSIEDEEYLAMVTMVMVYGIDPKDVVNIKINDINFDSGELILPYRILKLKKSFLKSMKKYLNNYSPKVYLFESNRGNGYSLRMLQVIIKSATQAAGIVRPVGKYAVRLSYKDQLLQLRLLG